MTYWALFWIELYFSWIIIEYIARRYDMIKNNKIEIMSIVGLALFGIFIGCASPDEEEITIKGMHRVEDAKAKHRAEAREYNESRAEEWREYYNRRVEEGDSVELTTVVHETDSTNIIAIEYPDDAFTDFEQAFMVAREELGKDKHFIWMNKMYSTNYKEEGYSEWNYQSKSSGE